MSIDVPTDALVPASNCNVGAQSSNPEVIAALEDLHALVLSVCPDCLIQARDPEKDGGLIYVPPERAHAKRYKNLLTVWPEATQLRMRIMPDDEEFYSTLKRSTYMARLKRLYGELRNRR